MVVGEGEGSVSLSCDVTGTPSLRVSWLKSETQNLSAVASPHYTINEVRINTNHVKSTLTIHRPTFMDSAWYTCVSTVLNDETDRQEFQARENATITVLGEK